MGITDPSFFGVTAFQSPEPVELARLGDPRQKVTVSRSGGQWRPPNRLRLFLPDDFSVPLFCYTGSDGVRRMIPRCSFEELIDLGAVGGLAVIHGIRGFDKEADHSYRIMHLIHQHVRGRAYRGNRGMKEHLTREFRYARDLHIRRTGRLADGERSILPESVRAPGEGRRWSIAELTKRGRQAAQEGGHRNPTSVLAIAYGLWEAARLNPLVLGDEEVPPLVRLALFDIDLSAAEPSPGLVEIVMERLVEAIHAHLDEPQEAFDGWFSGPNNSLVKQIAKQKRKRGGKLDQGDVRRALLHLGWQAYGYVGQCVHALMRTIENSIPDPLNEGERRIFERMHESQPYYGGLPAALLAERMHFLRPAVLAIWEDPEDPDHVRSLHRLLQYYVEMAHSRRAADRRSKQRSAGGARKSFPGVGAEDGLQDGLTADEDRLAPAPSWARGREFIENLDSPVAPGEDPFAQVGDHLRERGGIRCPAGCVNWEYRREGESQELVTIGMRCECGQVDQKIRMSLSEFAEQAQEVLDWRRSGSGDDSTPVGNPSEQG